MKLKNDEANAWQDWQPLEVEAPRFSLRKLSEQTQIQPQWVHFGAGNIFRGFIAGLQQNLLDEGLTETGIIAADTFDHEVIEKIYRPFDNLSLTVLMHTDGSLHKKLVASIAEGLCASPQVSTDWERLKTVFRNSSLQMVSFTITEKGYGLRSLTGEYLPAVQQDLTDGPAAPNHALSIAAALLFERFTAGASPLALVSMDNCSHNGDKLRSSLLEIVEAWVKNGLVPRDFADYVENSARVSFPWSMIDKITPRPSAYVQKALEAEGLEEMAPIVTARGTFIAPFVNTESAQYLVIEDDFPNGRPPLEKAGVLFTDRETVENTERMKVTTCLNPLHTALAVFGCLLGYTTIAEEMRDADLKKLIEKIGYEEGMPVVIDPGIINPQSFIREVIEERFPNPFIPDTPQRIATDTSQKIAVRFGETIRAYQARPELSAATLTYIPLALAGWLRYLLAVDDAGAPITLSADPMLAELQTALAGIELGNPFSYQGQLSPILHNSALFGTDLYAVGLAEKVEDLFRQMLSGPHAVRATLRKHLQ